MWRRRQAARAIWGLAGGEVGAGSGGAVAYLATYRGTLVSVAVVLDGASAAVVLGPRCGSARPRPGRRLREVPVRPKSSAAAESLRGRRADRDVEVSRPCRNSVSLECEARADLPSRKRSPGPGKRHSAEPRSHRTRRGCGRLTSRERPRAGEQGRGAVGHRAPASAVGASARGEMPSRSLPGIWFRQADVIRTVLTTGRPRPNSVDAMTSSPPLPGDEEGEGSRDREDDHQGRFRLVQAFARAEEEPPCRSCRSQRSSAPGGCASRACIRPRGRP
jgi:hypothetical protein